MAAAAVETRKRGAAPFLINEPPRLPKHRRRWPCPGLAAAVQRPLAFDPLDALRRVFPDADPGEVAACFDASGRDIHATVEAFRARQAKEAAVSRLARAAAPGAMDECAGVLVEQMAAAADVADAKNRASWILALIKDAVDERAAASSSTEATKLREENAALRAEAAKLREENAAATAAAERDNAVLKRGVALLHAPAAEMRKKVAELEMANYALRLRDADSCRFQAFRGPDVF